MAKQSKKIYILIAGGTVRETVDGGILGVKMEKDIGNF